MQHTYFTLYCFLRNMKHMQKRLRNDELRVLRGEVEVDEAQLDDDSADLGSSASEDEVQPAHQAPAQLLAVTEKTSVQTTDKGTVVEGSTLWLARRPICCRY